MGRPPTNYTAKIDAITQEFTASESTDPIWWGAEAKTKHKELKKLHDEILKKQKEAKTTEEGNNLEVQAKRLGCVMAVVEGVLNHGFDSTSFHQIFDNQLQVVALSGLSLDMPKFLLWHRSKGDIKSTDMLENWARRTTSAALRLKGVPDVDAEQQRLYSEKLASVLRMKDQKQRTSELTELCDGERAAELEPSVASFIESMSVCLTAEEIPNLDDRRELLSTALTTLGGMMPDKTTKQQGTKLGCTLYMFLPGKAVLLTAAAHLDKCALTLSVMKPFIVLIDGLASMLDVPEISLTKSSTSLLADDGRVVPINNQLRLVGESMQTSFGDCLPDFVPTAAVGSVKRLVHTWLAALVAGSADVLRPLISGSGLSSERIAHWVEATEGIRNTLTTCFELFTVFHLLVEEDTVIWKTLRSLHDAMRWFPKFNTLELVNSKDDSRAHCKAILELHNTFVEMCSGTVEVPPCELLFDKYTCEILDQPSDAQLEEVVSFNQRIGCLQGLANKAFFSDEHGPYRQAVVTGLWEDAKEQVTPLIEAFTSQFGVLAASRLQSIFPLRLSDEQFTRIATREPDVGMISSAREWADQAGDRLLGFQLEAVTFTIDMRRSLAQLQCVYNKDIRGSDSVKKRRVSGLQTEAIYNTQCAFKAFQTFVEAHHDSFDEEVCATAAATMHLPDLNNIIDLRAVWSSVEREQHKLFGAFCSSWSRDLRGIHDAINTFCPKWQLRRESMLEDQATVDAFLAMKPEHYNAIGPLVGELTSQLDLIEKVPGAIDPPLKAACAGIANYGIETVAFLCVVRALVTDFPLLKDQDVVDKAVLELEKTLEPTQVAMTNEMQKAIEAWKNGTKLSEKKAQLNPPKPAAGRTPAVPAVCPTPRAPEAAPDVPVAGPPEPEVQLSLAQRLLMAKRGNR